MKVYVVDYDGPDGSTHPVFSEYHWAVQWVLDNIADHVDDEGNSEWQEIATGKWTHYDGDIEIIETTIDEHKVQ